MKKHSLFAKLLVMLLCVALVFCGCQQSGNNESSDGGKEEVVPKTPEAQLSYSADKTMGVLLGSGSASSVFEEALKKGKVTVAYQDVFTNELYIDSANKYVADFLEVEVNGEEVDAQVFFKDGILAALVPMLLGDEAVGVDLNNIKDDLKNSALWDVLGVDFDEFMDAYNIDFDALTATLPQSLDSLGALETAVSEASKGVVMTSENKKVTVNGAEVDAIVVTVKLTSADVEKMVIAFVDWLVETYDEMVKNLEESAGDVDLEATLGVDLEEALDNAKDEITNAFAEIDLTLDCVVNISANTEYIMTMDLDLAGTVSGEEGAVRVDVNLGVNPSETDKYTLSIVGEEEGEVTGQIDMVLNKKTEGDSKETSFVVTVTEDGEAEEVFNTTVRYNTASSKYALDVTVDGTSLSVEGIYKYTDKVFELTIDKVSTNGSSTVEEISGLSIRVEAMDEVPQMPAYKNILKMTKEELEDFFSDIG